MAVFWWKIDLLRKSLAQRALTERARLIYLVLFVLLCTAVTAFPISNTELNGWGIASGVSQLVIDAAGTLWLYRINGGDQGQGFLERYLSLTFVYLLRYCLVAIPVLALIFFIGYTFEWVDDAPGAFEFMVILALLIPYYLGVARHWRLLVKMERGAS